MMSSSGESTLRFQGYLWNTIFIVPVKVFRKTEAPTTAGTRIRYKSLDRGSSQCMPVTAMVVGQMDSRLRMPTVHSPSELSEKVPN